MKVRLQKAIGMTGVLSRRKAEEAISEGRVQVNGSIITTLGTQVDTETDRISLDGKPLSMTTTAEVWVFHKPTGCLTSKSDPHGRKTIYDYLPKLKHLHTVGRLDWDSSGLLLLCNDGVLTHTLTHPSFGVEKEYEVTLHRALTPADEKALNTAVPLHDGAGHFLSLKRSSQSSPTYHVVVEEGRNRFVRRMFEHFEYEVLSLKRIRFGKIELASLKSGASRHITEQEQRWLKEVASRSGNSGRALS